MNSIALLSSDQSINVDSFLNTDADKKWNIPRWFALYTRSRHEKFIDQELRRKGIETFLPLRRVVRQWSDRQVTIEEPLFKGYLFVYTPLLNRLNVLSTKGAVNFIGSVSEPVEVPERELWAIRRFVEQEIQVDPFPYLKVGERIRVRSGPFKGVEGFIVRRDKHCRLVISFDLIMQSVTIEIDEACIESI